MIKYHSLEMKQAIDLQPSDVSKIRSKFGPHNIFEILLR